MLDRIWNPGIFFLSIEEHKDFILYCVIILEHLWWVRNEIWVKGEQPSLENSIVSVRNRFLEFKQGLVKAHQVVGISETAMFREWRPPQEGFLKINTDAAVRINGSVLSMVVRNRRGALLETHSFRVPTQDPAIAELWTIRQAIRICIRNQWKHVCCETDAKNVVHMLTEGQATSYHWSATPIFKEISGSNGFLDSITFPWCNRECNRLAHEMSKWAATNGFYGHINEECLPLSIFEILAMEKRVIPSIHARALTDV